MIEDIFYIFGSFFVIAQYIKITNKDRNRFIKQKAKKPRHDIQNDPIFHEIMKTKNWKL